MRTFGISILGVTMQLLLSVPLHAAQTGGLAAPVGQGGFATSVTLAYAERDVRDGAKDEVSSRRLLLRGQFGLLDGLDVYAHLGMSDLHFNDAEFEGALGENLGLGLRYAMLSFPDTQMKLVLDVQGEYLRSSDGPERVRNQTYHAAAYVLREVGAAGRLGYFYPYGGFRVSYSLFEARGTTDDYHGDDYVGVFAGADYFVSPQVFFAGEIHLFDETSLFLGVGYRF